MNKVNSYIEQQAKLFLDDLMEDWRNAGKKHIDVLKSKTKFGIGDNSTFNNITFNLRSSIGFILIYNGEIVEDYFPVVGGATEGAEVGKAWATEVGLQVNEHEGMQMVVVAGMEYAIYVETIHGIDVIEFASETELPKFLTEEMSR